MKFLFYAQGCTDAATTLRGLADRFTPLVTTSIETTLEDLDARLHQPRFGLNAVVLAPASREDLKELLTLKELLWDLRVLLVLPDVDSQTVSMGHQLCPRYVSQNDSGLQDRLEAVLTKITTIVSGPCGSVSV